MRRTSIDTAAVTEFSSLSASSTVRCTTPYEGIIIQLALGNRRCNSQFGLLHGSNLINE